MTHSPRASSERVVAISALVLPTVAIISIFIVHPFLSGLYLSFTDWNGISKARSFVGLRNFVEAFGDRIFIMSLANTAIYTIIVIAVQHSVSLALAMLVYKKDRGVAFYSSSLFIPSLLSAVVVGIVFSVILSPIDGPLNALLGLRDAAAVNWLGDPRIALPTVALVTVWQWLGYSMLIYIAGLQGVPSELVESARIDGAGAWRTFLSVEFPAIAPAFTINIILSLIGCMKTFEQVLVLTGGGPGNRTEVVGTYIYSAGFTASRFGYGTAISLFLFALIVAISFLQLRVLRKREEAFI